MAQATHAHAYGYRSPLESGIGIGLYARRVAGVFTFKGVGGSWSLIFNKRCGILLDPGMARLWVRTGMRRFDSPDGRSLGVVIPCVGRGFKGRVLIVGFGLRSSFWVGF